MDLRNMKIFISSLAFSGLSIEEIGAIAGKKGYAIEFSSGIAHDPQAVSKLETFSFPRYVHNYFPAPKEPFVLNLASKNPTIRRKSIEHCISGIDISKAIGASFFSVHAGFCIDPDPKLLGKPLGDHGSFDKEAHWLLFIQSLLEALAYAEKVGVKLLVENNVLARFNYLENINPLLCCDKTEILRLYNEVKSPAFGFLLDTAHWKVSADTLGFELTDGLDEILSKVDCIHHSDNDATEDTNEMIGEDYWFSKYIPTLPDRIHVVEVKDLKIDQINKQVQLLKSFSA